MTAAFTPETLATALRAAAEAHHAFEASLGHPDADWAGWYAKWIVEAQQPWLPAHHRRVENV